MKKAYIYEITESEEFVEEIGKIMSYGIKGWIALDYTEKINLDKLAKDVIQGKYGNGETRKKNLGILYDDVQARVNQILSKK